MDAIATILFFTFPAAMVMAAATDALWYRIPNAIVVLVVATYLGGATISGVPVDSIGWHLATGAAVLAAGTLLFSIGIIGGGDVKLIAAVACWTGSNALLAFLMWVGLIGGILAALMTALSLVRLGLGLSKPPAIDPSTGGRHRLFLVLPRKVPYGIAIAVSALLVLPSLDMARVVLAH